ncbi:MAG: NAD(P)-dependent alcohol dehydrogenase [Candidatus Heimdallarchaeota archaeon]|nr:NAD(P)-dependent alcohol dehydrogenase [Candidatus Heimdallarchaeota archaeon]
MKAILQTKYGPPEVLKLHEIEKPAITENQVLIKVHATSVTPMDYRSRSAKAPLWPISRILMGVRKPKQQIPGSEVAGEIVEVGKEVRKFKKGDKVFGFGHDTYAEYTTATEKSSLEIMPPTMSYEEGASIAFGGVTALYFLRIKANMQSGQRVLINGASGGVGVFAVQLATYFGGEVTGVCSTKNIELVRSLGAARVIDYTKDNFTKETDQKYEVIFDVVGTSSFSKCKKLLTEEGIYINIVPTYRLFFQTFWTSKRGKKKVITGIAQNNDDLSLLRELIAAKSIQVIIDRSYPLEQASEAHAYAEQGHKVGSVVITLDN